MQSAEQKSHVNTHHGPLRFSALIKKLDSLVAHQFYIAAKYQSGWGVSWNHWALNFWNPRQNTMVETIVALEEEDLGYDSFSLLKKAIG